MFVSMTPGSVWDERDAAKHCRGMIQGVADATRYANRFQDLLGVEVVDHVQYLSLPGCGRSEDPFKTQTGYDPSLIRFGFDTHQRRSHSLVRALPSRWSRYLIFEVSGSTLGLEIIT